MTEALIAGRYRRIRPLGEGAMGTVWQVEDTATGQVVALKLISAKYRDAAKSVLQFKQEFRLMTQLRHPNCCAVYDYGVAADGEPYFTMEEVPGHGLDELVPLPAERIQPILTQLLLALGYIHQRGFVHLDLKPANVRVTPDGVVKLMDYGLMGLAGVSGGPIVGTIGYLAPEVIRRGPLDQRTDLYSLGVLLHAMLTGRLPFESEKPAEVLQAHLQTTPQPLSRWRAGVDAGLERVALRLLAKGPVERFQSAYQVLAAIGAEVPAGIGGNLLTSPIVGREGELGALSAALADVVAGRPGQAVLLVGPPGSGKSRLVEEFRFRVQWEHLLCGVGAPDAAGTPYGPIVRALRVLLPALKARVPEVLTSQAPVLVKLLPELAVTPVPDSDSPGHEKRRLQAAITETLRALARTTPYALVIDRLEDADPLTRELIDELLRTMADMPVLLVATSREAPAADSAWARLARVQPLSTLSDPAVAAMVASMLGQADVAPAFTAALVAFSGGVPRAIERALEHLVQAGRLVADGGHWPTDLALAPADFPADAGAALETRLAALPVQVLAVARTAAVLGGGFSADLLELMGAAEDEALIDAIYVLQQSRILVVDERRELNFTQPELQAALYEQLAPDERRRLHGVAADVLAARFADRPLAEAPLEQLAVAADHYVSAGAHEETIRLATAVCGRYARMFAADEALRFLNAALMRIATDPPGRWLDERTRCLRHMGDVYRCVARHEEAREAYLEARPLAAQLGDGELEVHILTGLAKAEQSLDQLDDALARCDEALAIAQRVGDLSGAARSLLISCRLHFFRGDMGAAIDHTERAVQAAREAGDPSRIGEALAFIGSMYVAFSPESIETGIANFREAIAVLEAISDRPNLVNAYLHLGDAQITLGDYLPALASFEQARHHIEESGMFGDLNGVFLNLAAVCLELGRYGEAVAYALETERLAIEQRVRFIAGLAVAFGAMASARLGDLAQVPGRMAEALATAEALKHKYMRGLVLQGRLETWLHLGDLAAAEKDAEALAELFRETLNYEPEKRMHAALALVRARRGEHEVAGSLANRAREAAEICQAKGVKLRALMAHAYAALVGCDYARARAEAEAALALAEQLACRQVAAVLHGIAGEAAMHLDGDARAHFDAMLADAQACGDGALEAEALYGQAASRPYAPDSAGLAEAARAQLQALAARLGGDEAQRFLCLRERIRIVAGDYKAMRPKPSGAKTGPLQMPFGLPGGL